MLFVLFWLLNIYIIKGTKYSVIKRVGEDIFKWKLSKKINNDWDVCWTDGKIPYTFLGKMKPY